MAHGSYRVGRHCWTDRSTGPPCPPRVVVPLNAAGDDRRAGRRGCGMRHKCVSAAVASAPRSQRHLDRPSHRLRQRRRRRGRIETRTSARTKRSDRHTRRQHSPPTQPHPQLALSTRPTQPTRQPLRFHSTPVSFPPDAYSTRLNTSARLAVLASSFYPSPLTSSATALAIVDRLHSPLAVILVAVSLAATTASSHSLLLCHQQRLPTLHLFFSSSPSLPPVCPTGCVNPTPHLPSPFIPPPSSFPQVFSLPR